MQYAIKRIKTKEREERRRKINGSNYNREYIRAMVEKRPEYLVGKRKKRDRCLIARFKCGNELRRRQLERG